MLTDSVGDDGLADALESLLAYAAQCLLAEEEALLARAPELFLRRLPLHNAFIETTYSFIQEFNDGRRDGLAARLRSFAARWLAERAVRRDRMEGGLAGLVGPRPGSPRRRGARRRRLRPLGFPKSWTTGVLPRA